MEEILHQLRLVVYPMVYKVVKNIPGGCLGFLPPTVIKLHEFVKYLGGDWKIFGWMDS